MIDYGDEQQTKQDDENTNGIGVVSKLNSLENTLRKNSIHGLSNSPTNLDQLIGASSALEMADGDTEYLKIYSERVAMEAD